MQAGAGYQSIGSFHNESLPSVVARVAQEDYERVLRARDDADDAGAGDALRVGRPGATLHAPHPDFLLDLGRWVFINHGAFGAPCRAAFDAAQRWRAQCEQQPLDHIDRVLLPEIARSTCRMAAYVGVPPVQLVPLQNVTQAFNAVARQVARHSGGGAGTARCWVMSTAYGSLKVLAAQAFGAARVVTCEIDLDTLGDDERLLQCAVRSMPDDGSVALIMLDHISSNTARLFPVERLARALHARAANPRAVVFIDAAHALWQLDARTMVPAKALAGIPTAYAFNTHKWLCNVRGCAFMYFHEWQPEPLVVSHGFTADRLSAFAWDGTRDYAPVLALPATLEFWGRKRCARARDYSSALVEAGAAMLVREWRSRAMFADARVSAPCMRLVEVPAELAKAFTGSDVCSSDVACALQDALHDRFRIEVPVKALFGRLWVRISAHVYNCAADYEALARALAPAARSATHARM